jgi:hypothetical protein
VPCGPPGPGQTRPSGGGTFARLRVGK